MGHRELRRQVRPSSHLPTGLIPRSMGRTGDTGGHQESFSLYSQVKIEEPVSMEMDNHLSDKDESCYDNAEAAFSDDEEDLNSKGKISSRECLTCDNHEA